MSDNFKIAAREKGFQMREFEHSPEVQDTRKQEFKSWCKTRIPCAPLFSSGAILAMVSAWIHFCTVRIFAESILQYGLLPSFLSAVISPSTKSEKKVRSILEDCSGNVQREKEMKTRKKEEGSIARNESKLMELGKIGTLLNSFKVDVSIAEGAAGDAITTELDADEAWKFAECIANIIFEDPTVKITNVERLHWIHPSSINNLILREKTESDCLYCIRESERERERERKIE
ncbi:uncharacterized protein LOC144549165 [Carex rostrata]